MKFKFLIILVTVFIFSFLFMFESSKSGAAQKSSVKWEQFNKGLSKAARQNRYIIIDFYADWCHWCKVMDKETFSDSEVVRILNTSYVAVRVNTDKNESVTYKGRTVSSAQFATLLGIQGLPTVVFMDKDGNLIDKVPGYIKADIFTGILRYISEGCYKQQVSFTDYMNNKVNCK